MSGEKPPSGPVRKMPKTDSDERTQELENLHLIDDKKLTVAEKSMYKGPNSESYEGTYDSRRAFVKRFPAAQKRFFEEEATILSELKHENIVEFIGIINNEESKYYEIVTEFLEGGTLQALFDDCRNRSKPLPLPQAIRYALDIARAMEYVHQKKFLHRDLKPENVLLSEHKERAVLVDFGHARKEDVNGMSGYTGTPEWMAPEVMPKEKGVLYTHKADVFSFSIILWELITSKIPYHEIKKSKDAILEDIRKNGLRPNLEDIKIRKLITLLKSCWAPKPDSRPEFSEIITKLQEILHKLDAQRTSVPKTVSKDQPRNGQGGDAP